MQFRSDIIVLQIINNLTGTIRDMTNRNKGEGLAQNSVYVAKELNYFLQVLNADYLNC